MNKKKAQSSEDYLETLEEIKKQYQQYVETSGLYDLPTSTEVEEAEYAPPSFDNPLTTNTFRVK